MQEVIILVGISGAGKSTFASSFIKKNSTAVRLNRDSIREMLIPNGSRDSGYYKRLDLFKLEEMVSKIEDITFQTAIDQRRDIIIDNTNLSQKYVAHWLFEAGEADVKFKLFDCAAGLAKSRVLKRDFNTVTDDEVIIDSRLDYIDKQYKSYEAIKQWLIDNHTDKII